MFLSLSLQDLQSDLSQAKLDLSAATTRYQHESEVLLLSKVATETTNQRLEVDLKAARAEIASLRSTVAQMAADSAAVQCQLDATKVCGVGRVCVCVCVCVCVGVCVCVCVCGCVCVCVCVGVGVCVCGCGCVCDHNNYPDSCSHLQLLASGYKLVIVWPHLWFRVIVGVKVWRLPTTC